MLVAMQPASGWKQWEMPPDMLEEYRVVRDVLPFVAFNGQDGVFVDKGIKPYSPDDHPQTMDGIMLSVTYGQVWLGKDGEGWSQKWICRAPNILKPPIVNQELSDNERADVLARGAGCECNRCPLSKWNEKSKPPCSSNVTVLLLQSDNTMALVSFGATSFASITRWIGAEFRRSMRPWFSAHVKFTRERKTVDGKSWWVAKGAIVSDVDYDRAMDLSRLRQQYLDQAEQLPVHHDDEISAKPVPEVTASSKSPPNACENLIPEVMIKPSIYPKIPSSPRGSFRLSDDGTPIWDDGEEDNCIIPF